MEKVNCIICNQYNDSKIAYFIDNKENMTYHLSKCNSCNFIYLNPQLDIAEMSDHYKSDYIPYKYRKENLYDYFFSILQKINFMWKKSVINKYNSNKNSILDIGSGNNSFSHYMCRNNFNCISYDKFSELADINSLEQVKNECFDIITLWHSIEHIHELNDLLLNIKKLINKDGYIFIACPNYDAPERKYLKKKWVAYDIPRHLYHFNYKSLNKLLNNNNIEIINYHIMMQDTIFNIFSTKDVNLFYKIYITLVCFFKILLNKRKSSSILYVCKLSS